MSDRRLASVAVMRKVDSLPPEFRALVHLYGCSVWTAYLNGWSPQQIKAAATPDGCFSTRKAKKHNAMGVHRKTFSAPRADETGEGERDG